jgi:acyl transferase
MIEGIEFTQHRIATDGGRSIAVWRIRRPQMPQRGVMLITPGFARRMDHLCALAMNLADNGIDVYRYDPLDHVGLSDGEITHYSLSTGLSSLRAVAAWMRETQSVRSMGLIAVSLGAPVAYRYAAEDSLVAFVISAVGVVNVKRTLRQVWDLDFPAMAPHEMPLFAEFEGHYIDPRPFCAAAHRDDWWTLDSTISVLRRLRQPIVCFAGLDDDWVDPADLQVAFERGGGGPRRIVQLEHCAHDLGRNFAAARIFFHGVNCAILELLQVEGGAIVESSFERITHQALVERRMNRRTASRPRIDPLEKHQIIKMREPSARTRAS